MAESDASANPNVLAASTDLTTLRYLFLPLSVSLAVFSFAINTIYRTWHLTLLVVMKDPSEYTTNLMDFLSNDTYPNADHRCFLLWVRL